MNKKEVRIAFMGTASFSSFVLKGLLDNGYNVVAVVSQPDKEIGRKRILEETEVKKLAKEYNIPVYQPIKLRKEFDFFNDIKPDLVISAAYGQIVPDEVLVLPKYGCINVHGSLLPAYRGGAPIQRAIINGDSKTGITIMEMAHDMDAGVMYSKAEVEISDDDNYETLINKLMVVGRDLLLATLPDYLDGKIKGEVQRNKGLGALSEAQARRSMFTEEFQRMEQLIPSEESLFLLEDLMGENVEPRRKFIFNNIDFSEIRE